jgi:ABC-2 type transport system permease protein
VLASEVKILFRKEWRQLLSSRGAMLSALIFPFLFLVVIPGIQLIAFTKAGVAPMNLPPPSAKLPPALADMARDPKVVVRALLTPFIGIAGLIVPSITATYSLLTERESKTIELLIALPVRVSQILVAKLLAILLLAGGTTLAMFSVDAVLIVVLRVGSVGFVLALLAVLLSGLSFSTTSALLVSLLAKDFRTSNNLNGALFGPTIIVSMGIGLLITPPTLAALILSAIFLTGAAACAFVAMRVVTFERLLR